MTESNARCESIKDRPIIFSTEMVRALLDGRKTQTRRVVKKRKIHPDHGDPNFNQAWIDGGNQCEYLQVPYSNGTTHRYLCPFGIPGERLWVREGFITGFWTDDLGNLTTTDDDGNDLEPAVWFRADRDLHRWLDEDEFEVENIPWKPSIHMPRQISRITLEIARVWPARIQEISFDDCLKEGIAEAASVQYGSYQNDTIESFQELWNSINAKRPGCSWNDNPWVWCVEFKIIGKAV